MNILTSIVTANYNSEQFIAETIISVQNQSIREWEWWIIDNGSSDTSPEIIKSFLSSDPRIKLIRLSSNFGPAKARNIGIAKATGRFLTFIDSDDIWKPCFLEISRKTIDAKNCSFVFASYERVNEKLQKVYSDFVVPNRVSYRDILKTNPISCLTAMIDLSSLGKHFMSEDLGTQEDYTLWLQLLRKVEFAFGIKEPLAQYRIRSSSFSRNKYQTAINQWKVYREKEQLGWLESIYYISNYVFHGLRKYGLGALISKSKLKLYL